MGGQCSQGLVTWCGREVGLESQDTNQGKILIHVVQQELESHWNLSAHLTLSLESE